MDSGPHLNFFAVLEDHGKREVRHVRVEQALQADLQEILLRQAEDLISADEEVQFDGRYHPTEDEVFYIDDFPLSDDLRMAIEKPTSVETLDRATSERWDALTALIGGYIAGKKREIVFQAFDRRRSLARSSSIILRKETFSRLEDPGIILDNRAAAVIRGDRLYFRSYLSARRVVDLVPYYRSATDQDLSTFAKLPQVAIEDTSSFLNADEQVRRKVALITDSKILDRVKPNELRRTAADYGLQISVKGGRIVLPRETRDLKRVLRFLEENYFTSDLTGTRYLTSSKRLVK